MSVTLFYPYLLHFAILFVLFGRGGGGGGVVVAGLEKERIEDFAKLAKSLHGLPFEELSREHDGCDSTYISAALLNVLFDALAIFWFQISD